MLFHVELEVEEVEVNLINGNYCWMNKVAVDGVRMDIDKSTDFIFLKGSAKDLTISDLTGFPKTNKVPFKQL